MLLAEKDLDFFNKTKLKHKNKRTKGKTIFDVVFFSAFLFNVFSCYSINDYFDKKKRNY